MDKDTKRLFAALAENADQLDQALPLALRPLPLEARVLMELLHNRDLIIRCLLSHVLAGPIAEDVPNAETSVYSTLKTKKQNAQKQR